MTNGSLMIAAVVKAKVSNPVCSNRLTEKGEGNVATAAAAALAAAAVKAKVSNRERGRKCCHGSRSSTSSSSCKS